MQASLFQLAHRARLVELEPSFRYVVLELSLGEMAYKSRTCKMVNEALADITKITENIQNVDRTDNNIHTQVKL